MLLRASGIIAHYFVTLYGKRPDTLAIMLIKGEYYDTSFTISCLNSHVVNIFL